MITMPCPDCGGDKGWDYPVAHDPFRDTITYGWQACGCETGEIEVETLPLELEDVTGVLVPADGWEHETAPGEPRP